MTLRALGLTLIACEFAAPVLADDNFTLPEYTIHRAAEPPTIDGKLDDAVWKKAAVIDQFVFPWHTSGEKEPSAARLLWVWLDVGPPPYFDT